MGEWGVCVCVCAAFLVPPPPPPGRATHAWVSHCVTAVPHAGAETVASLYKSSLQLIGLADELLQNPLARFCCLSARAAPPTPRLPPFPPLSFEASHNSLLPAGWKVLIQQPGAPLHLKRWSA